MNHRSNPAALRLVAGLVLLLALVGTAASAQKVELTPFVGYRFGGEFEREGRFDSFRSDREVDESSSLGVALGFYVSRNFQIELLFSRQDTELIQESGLFDPGSSLLDLDVDYYHVGVLYQWTPGQVQPFVGASIGATRFRPDGPGFDDESRFSLSFGGGVKLMFNQTIGLRLEGRVFTTVVDDEDEFCDSFSCYRYDDGEYLIQGEARGGLVFSF